MMQCFGKKKPQARGKGKSFTTTLTDFLNNYVSLHVHFKLIEINCLGT
jgi:hypothetical protein